MSKTRVSLGSNSNSLPHSAAAQRARDFSLLSESWFSGRMTTQIPHFGQVTHEHTMRSAMRKLYGPRIVRRVPRRSSWWLRKVGNLGTAVLACVVVSARPRSRGWPRSVRMPLRDGHDGDGLSLRHQESSATVGGRSDGQVAQAFALNLIGNR
jgi:hypothetical protein